MSEDVVICLQKMKAIYSDPKFWIQGDLAVKDGGDTSCAPTSQKACGWCMLGAVAATGEKKSVREKTIRRLAKTIREKMGWGCGESARDTIMDFNDDSRRKFKDVMKVIDKTIDAELAIPREGE